jgi:hypothetical protein
MNTRAKITKTARERGWTLDECVGSIRAEKEPCTLHVTFSARGGVLHAVAYIGGVYNNLAGKDCARRVLALLHED